MKIAYTGGSDPIDDSQETFRLCVCANGKTFGVPAPYKCNEASDPCL